MSAQPDEQRTVGDPEQMLMWSGTAWVRMSDLIDERAAGLPPDAPTVTSEVAHPSSVMPRNWP